MTPSDLLATTVGPAGAVFLRVLLGGGFVLLAAVLTARALGWPVGRLGRRLAVTGLVLVAAATVLTVLVLAGAPEGVPTIDSGAALTRLGVLVGIACFLPDLVGTEPHRWHRIVAGWFVLALAIVVIIPDAHPTTGPAAVGWVLVGLTLVAAAGWAGAALTLMIALHDTGAPDPVQDDDPDAPPAKPQRPGLIVLDVLRRTAPVLVWSMALLVLSAAARWLLLPTSAGAATVPPLVAAVALLLALLLVSWRLRLHTRRIAFRAAYRERLGDAPERASVGGSTTAVQVRDAVATEVVEPPITSPMVRVLLVAQGVLAVALVIAVAVLSTATLA